VGIQNIAQAAENLLELAALALKEIIPICNE
jgi:hypothetical protein